MRASLVIAGKDLRQRLRDRSALIIAFVAPLGLALIISGAVGGGFSGRFGATFGVLDSDQSELSRAFKQQVLLAPQFSDEITVADLRSADEGRDLINNDTLAAAFVIPKGFSNAIVGSRRTAITVLRNPDSPIGSEVAEAIANAYTGQINAGRLAVLTAIRAGGGALDPATVSTLARAAAAERIPVELVSGNVGTKKVNAASYFGPAMAIFFLFFTTSFAARSLLAEREQGTMPRLLAAPIRRASVLAAKALTGFFVGMASLTVMFVTFGLLLDVDWGDPLTIAVLSVATVLAVMGLTSVVQSLARTQEQADAYSNILGIALALIGGSFFPLFQLPDLIQRISVIAPNAWALRGFNDIVYDGATLTDLGPHLAVLLGFAVVTSGIAAARARRLSIR